MKTLLGSTRAIWTMMRQRVYNPRCNHYDRYGGRGIGTCERWNSFDNFLADMGVRPSRSHSLERIDNNRNYEPSNCKWATDSEQMRNTRIRKDNKTGRRGVAQTRTGSFTAYISLNGKIKYLGTFREMERAALARFWAECIYWPGHHKPCELAP